MNKPFLIWRLRKKSGSSINPDIQKSKVPSSGLLKVVYFYIILPFHKAGKNKNLDMSKKNGKEKMIHLVPRFGRTQVQINSLKLPGAKEWWQNLTTRLFWLGSLCQSVTCFFCFPTWVFIIFVLNYSLKKPLRIHL